jgi:hypothetical protein
MHLILSDRSTVRFRFDLNWTVKRQLWSHRDPKELELARRVWDLRYRRGGELTWWEQDAAAVADAEVLLQIRTEVTRVRWRGCNLYLDSRAAATGGGDSAARGRRRRWRLDCWTEAGVVVLDGGRMKETRAELFSRASGDSRGSGALSVEVGRRRPVEKGRIGSSSPGRWASKRQDALARGWRVTWASHPRKRPGSLRDFGFPKGPWEYWSKWLSNQDDGVRGSTHCTHLLFWAWLRDSQSYAHTHPPPQNPSAPLVVLFALLQSAYF